VSAGFEVGAARVEGDRASALVRVPAELPYFDGHFAGRPVLPAVAQLEALVVPLCQDVWRDLAAPRRMVRLKFRRVIAPGSELLVRLERKGDARTVVFTIERAGDVASSGTIEFSEAVA